MQGSLRVRLDEGEVASAATLRRGFLLYKHEHLFVRVVLVAFVSGTIICEAVAAGGKMPEAATGVGNSRYDGIVRCEGASVCKGYTPPLLMNGELAMTVDRTFAVLPNKARQYSQGIFLQGRRFGNPRRELLPQGGWRKVLLVDGHEPSGPVRWEQELDIKAGTVVCREMRAELDFEGEVFLPFGENTAALRLVVTAKRDLKAVTLGVEFLPPKHERIIGRLDGLKWEYASYGMNVLKGETVLSARPETFDLKRGERRVVERFFTFSDTMRPHSGRHGSYDDLRAAHVAGWEAFRSEGFASLPDRDLQRMHDMANFHLRMNATPWSFPIAILDSHWQGCYFGFDEMYMYQGLSSSGHLTLARRVVDFRFAALPRALERNRYGMDPKFLHYGARWMWESLEDGGITEGTIPGEWMDHIFGVATIANCAWQQGRYVRDDAYFRKKVFPIVLESARFFRNNWVYEDSNGDTYIGKCCDLERLGPSRDHPYLTTVGAIYTMRNAADACEWLGTNLEEAKDFRHAADRLEAWLPKKDGRYLAYIPAKARAGRSAEGIQESMAVLGGFYPFPIFSPTHEPQRLAVRRFIAEGRASGNMYPTGSKICSWYAGTMSSSMSWMEDRVEPTRWLKEAFSVSGNFGEFYEINEEGCVHHPWFGTAAGNCLYAINRMLLLDRDGATYLAFTVPTAWRDYSFRLPSLEGDVVSMSVADGKLKGFAVDGKVASGSRRFVVRPEILDGVDLLALGLRVVNRGKDRVALEL